MYKYVFFITHFGVWFSLAYGLQRVPLENIFLKENGDRNELDSPVDPSRIGYHGSRKYVSKEEFDKALKELDVFNLAKKTLDSGNRRNGNGQISENNSKERNSGKNKEDVAVESGRYIKQGAIQPLAYGQYFLQRTAVNVPQQDQYPKLKSAMRRKIERWRSRSRYRVPVFLPQKESRNGRRAYFRATVISNGSTHRAAHTHASTAMPPSDKKLLSPFSIYRDLQNITSQFPDLNITLEILGRTTEYNDIVLMKISGSNRSRCFRTDPSKFADDAPPKNIIFIVHGLSVMGFNDLPCMRTYSDFKELLSFYFAHLEKFDIFLIPFANPDGVAMARTKTFWNKNMSPQQACPGVALDRNFDVGWNVSHCINSCSQNYPGLSPFSEIESQVVRTVLHKYSTKIVGFFHVHAGMTESNVFKGDAILYPKGYTDQQSDDDKYIDLKGDIDETMKNASFKVYSMQVVPLSDWYGVIIGSSVDYASSVYGIPYCVELVMQLYDDNLEIENSKERETTAVLREVWKKAIDVLFVNIDEYANKDRIGPPSNET